MGRRKKKRNGKLVTVTFLIAVVAVGGYIGYSYYNKIFAPNVAVAPGMDEAEVHISTGSDYDDVVDQLASQGVLKDTASFNWVARRMNYPNHVYPGRYVFQKGMNNREIVNKLRSGIQDPLNLTLNMIDRTSELAGIAGRELEADSSQIMELLNNGSFLSEYGLDEKTVMCMFLPNTYEFYWNTDAREFIERMYQEYRKFWTEEHRRRAREEGLTEDEACILATIIQKESSKRDEWPVIAGVYMNRLERGWKLQADPTLKFVITDREVKRIYKKDLEMDTPYNTYMYKGLPPGPIAMPEIAAIEAVLNAREHDYMYFCARADFSGYHHFSETLLEHLNYANQYQRALNQRKIY